MVWRRKTRECAHCGALHEYRYADGGKRGLGRRDCLECGKELISWYGRRLYEGFQLLQRASVGEKSPS